MDVKVYDHQPRTQMTLLAAMEAACEDITEDACRGWIRHSKSFFFFHIALQVKISDVMWMRICGPTDWDVMRCRQTAL